MQTMQGKGLNFLQEICSQRSKTIWRVGSEGLFLHSVLKTECRSRKIDLVSPDTTDDLVAQLVEHNTFNVGALGSSPSGITKHNKTRYSSGFCININSPLFSYLFLHRLKIA